MTGHTARGRRPMRAAGALGAILVTGLAAIVLAVVWLSGGAPEVREGPVRLVFMEDWTQGLRTDRWVPFGEPQPYVRPAGGPEGAGYFVNNGDDYLRSGVASRLALSPAGGISLEFWARMPFSGKQYQRLGVGLSVAEPPADSREWSDVEPIVNLVIAGPCEEGGAWARVTLAGHWFEVGIPDEPGAWHRYVLQLDADGTVSLHIDGAAHWWSPDRLPPKRMQPLHVVLGYRSVETEIAHGPVRVYQGSRYLVPETG